MRDAPHISLVIATRNRHKVGEIRAILSGRYECQTLNEFPDAPPVIEDAPTFAGNAAKKALELARWLAQRETRSPELGTRKSELGTRNVLVLADDSGLEVDALEGAPGVHSARFAALDGGAGAAELGNSPDAANNAKLLRLLENIPLEKRTARFRCVLAMAEINPQPSLVAPKSDGGGIRPLQLFEGVCEGRISFSPAGQGGFGYDPLFVPVGYEVSFAELGEEVKNKISHRARALENLRQRFPDRG